MAQWGPRTPGMARCTGWWSMLASGLNGDTSCIERLDVYDIDMKWLPGLIGDIKRLKMDWSWCGSYSDPKAHWGPRTSRMVRCTWCWCMVAPRVYWGHMTHWMARYTCRWYKVGWLWTQNVQNWIDLDVAHVVAPTAHWGTSSLWMARCIKFWYMLAPSGDIMHCMASYTYHWYKVAPRAHWGHRTSVNG